MAAPPELSQLLALSRDRTAYQNPLFQAVTQMAYSGLPTYARQGTQLSGTLSNQAPPAPSGGGGMNPALAAGLGGLGGAALNSLGPNGNALGALIDGIKKLFGHGGQGVQGNKPYGGGALTGPGMDRDFTGWHGSRDPSGRTNPVVTTSEGFSFPNDVFNDPFFLNSVSNGMPTDPSGGSGVGPGMQSFYDWLKDQSGGPDDFGDE